MDHDEDLIVEAVDFVSFRAQRERPLINGAHTYSQSCLAVVTVLATDGTQGLGLLADPLVHGGERVYSAILDVLRPQILGTSCWATERLWSAMWSPKLMGRRGFETRVMSAVDMALWDIKAKRAGVSMVDFLGSCRDAAPFYVAGGYYLSDSDERDIDETIEHSLSFEPSGIKMKIGRRDIDTDFRRVERAKRLLPDAVSLMVDSNGVYSTSDAVLMAHQLERLGIAWFEEPVPPDNLDGYAAVSRSSSVPVAGGENEATIYGFRDLIERGGVSYINVDAQIAGGLTQFMKIAALAEAHGVEVAPHGSTAVHASLVCAIQNGAFIEFYSATVDPLSHIGLIPEIRTRNGLIEPPAGKGYGFDIDYPALEASFCLRH